MDIEWALDGLDNKLYIVQARPETVESSSATNTLERYELKEKSNIIVTGRAIGKKLGQGIAKIIKDTSGIGEVKAGDVLVTDMTDPDWEPVMKKASAIVTNRGGRTCHAAIIARELGIPAIVGCGDATKIIQNNSEITVSCTEGDTGNVYEGILDYQVNTSEIGELADPPVKIMMNIANPGLAFSTSAIPNMGVGLARLEFIINNTIGIHPKALLNFNALKDEAVKSKILSRIHNQDPIEYYVSKLTQGIATLCASFAPKPVIVRMSDFKSNEYANLIGGALYEPFEENPMIGFRGTSRYLADEFTDCFELECQAIKRVRNDMGLSNLQLMVPFVRTVAGAKKVIALLAKNGLKRGENGLKVIMMCEIPANAVLAEQFLKHFDGFSIGSNDLTQLTLGLDRDSEKISHLFDERNEAVKALITLAITACKKHNKYIGICGQGPSDFPDFAHWLVEQDIDSISLNPDTVINTWQYLSKSFPDKTYL
jgi:pyruvate,water dikinase